ncbi:MAG TPA: Gldg family protein [Verrucomicrobiae bacterium]|nr:Gldg family protein [Verrucomicrobiae bacterium]
MKSKSFETVFYSAAGIVAMAVILIAVNLLGSAFKTRADLTADKLYTLSSGTKAILAKLDTPVTIRFYCTQGATPTAETVYLQNYAGEVGDLLDEYREASHGKIVIQKLDPEPDSDAEDSARLDGLEPESLSTGDQFYLGLAVSQLDAKQTVPLTPDRERLLEYDISRAISRVMNPEKPVVGVMSALPVFGAPANPMMQQMGQQGSQPWQIINELSGDYTLRQVPLDADKIDDDIKVLLVIHPGGISDAAQFAIDQFILRGGKLIAFLDPLNIVAERSQGQMMPQEGANASTLDKLLKAWGIEFQTAKAVADLNFKMQLAGQNGQPMEAPAFLNVNGEGLNTNDIITSELSDVWLPIAGAFTGEPVAGLQKIVLLKSTTDSELADAFMANMSGDEILQNFKSGGVQYPLAIELTGKFKTAFPDGKPAEGTNAVAKTSEKFLKESAATNTVILVGDADMLANDFSLRIQDTPFGTMAMALNGNLNFAENAIEQLAGGSNLIAVRSRAVADRPFTVIKKMEAQAQTEYQSKIKDLQDSLQDTQQRLSELQQAKGNNQRYILSPEQQAEVENFQKKEASVKSDLRKLQKDLRRDVNSLQTRVEWMNIAAMPIVVSVFGVCLAAWKRKRTSAQ